MIFSKRSVPARWRPSWVARRSSRLRRNSGLFALLLAMPLVLSINLATQFMLPNVAHAAPKCQRWFNAGTGKPSKTLWGARFSARTAWFSKVKSLYGARWVFWHKARERHYYCEVLNNSNNRCIAYAKACSY